MLEILSRNPWKLGATVALVLGVVVGAFVMFTAWDHNAQNEVHSAAGIHWGHWLSLGLGGFAPGAVVGGLLGLGLSLGARLGVRGRG